MRLSLIYPPNQYLEAPPLGISYLKGFLSHNLKDIEITNIDLNLFQGTYNNLLLGLCDYCLKRKTCEYFKLSSRDIGLFYGEQLRCAGKLFNNVTGAGIFLNETGNRAVKYLEKGFQEYISLITAEFKPDSVGISLADSSQVLFGLFLAKCMKEALPDCNLIVGGSFVNHCSAPENILRLKFIDYCIYGDGEIPFKKLLERIRDKSHSLEDIPNLIHKDGGSIIKNKEGYRKTFSELPYPVFDNIDRYEFIPLLQSFGCPHGKCTFCSYFKDGRFRQKGTDSLMNEIRFYVKTYKKRNFIFRDNSVTAGQLESLSKSLIKNKLHINYSVMCKPSSGFNRDVLRTAFQSGCREIFWGVESSSQRILTMMRKDFSFRYFSRILKMSGEAGINNQINIIAFFPTQKENELLSDVRFLIRSHHALQDFKWSYFWIEEGDFIYRHLKQFRVGKIEKLAVYSHPGYIDHGLFSLYYQKKHAGRDNNGIFFEYCGIAAGKSKMSKYLLEAEKFYILKKYAKVQELLNEYSRNCASPGAFFLAGLTKSDLRSLRGMKRRFDPQETYKRVARGFRKSLTPQNAMVYFNELDFPSRSRAGRINTADFLDTFLKAQFKRSYKELLMAYACHASGQYDAAIKHAIKAKGKLSDETAVHLILGLCYEKKKRYEKAIEEYKKAQKISPEPGINLSLHNCYRNILSAGSSR